MRLCCSKCKAVLTSDLYQVTPRFDSEGYLAGGRTRSIFNMSCFDPDERYYNPVRMKKGVFYSSKALRGYNNKYSENKPSQIVRKETSALVVAEDSLVTGLIPDMPSGCGCCNFSMGEKLYCSCGNFLGDMYLDCYELGVVHFSKKNVDRVYKISNKVKHAVGVYKGWY